MVNKKEILTEFKKIENKLVTLDSKYLLGKIKKESYYKQRNKLKNQFFKLKKKLIKK